MTLTGKYRTPQPIFDPTGKVYVHLAGRPLSEGYTEVTEGVDKVLAEAAEALHFLHGQRESRRGPFPTISVGITSGNGNSVCTRKSLRYL